MKIQVPYSQQYNNSACGAACLVMVYKHYGLKDITQQEIFEKNKEQEPHGTGATRIATSDLVNDAKERGFNSYSGQVDYSNNDKSIEFVKQTIKNKIPLIVCQQWKKDRAILGHFRVVVGYSNKYICVHDPDLEDGSRKQKWSYEKFMDYWQRTGDNVIGGQYVIIENK
ncbi:C39 family peptidase [Patescibacteria group bacterium]|nr:C39 family peptidase [Patescibacteria group bacterium]